MRMPVAALVVSLTIMLLGCSNSGTDAVNWIAYRNGPDPIISSDQVKTYVTNQATIMSYLSTNTVVDDPKLKYYDIAVTGFNYVDQECDSYLHELYAIDHERDRFKGIVGSTGLLTEAILSAVPASKVSIGVVAQAFGLSSELADTVANSYLFHAHSADVYVVVEKMQFAYREQAKIDGSKIASESEAYTYIRGYLRLCLPPTIESKMSQGLASLKTEPVKSDSKGASVTVQFAK